MFVAPATTIIDCRTCSSAADIESQAYADRVGDFIYGRVRLH